ncbi:MAG: hypothetical protein QME81_17420, partial [bacterium]|nr:hypothetical protein [bacterium]
TKINQSEGSRQRADLPACYLLLSVPFVSLCLSGEWLQVGLVAASPRYELPFPLKCTSYFGLDHRFGH